jgi:hypothetical protein
VENINVQDFASGNDSGDDAGDQSHGVKTGATTRTDDGIEDAEDRRKRMMVEAKATASS